MTRKSFDKTVDSDLEKLMLVDNVINVVIKKKSRSNKDALFLELLVKFIYSLNDLVNIIHPQ